MIPISYYLYLSFFMFTMGALTVLLRRSAIVMLMGVELMLNAVNVSFVAFSSLHSDLNAQVVVFFVMVIAAAESGVGLAIIISLFRSIRTTDTEEASSLRQ